MATKKKNKKTTKKTTKKNTKKAPKKVETTKSTPATSSAIDTQKQILKDLGVDIDSTPKTPEKPPEKPAEGEGKGQLKRTKNPSKKTRADEMWDSIKDRPIEVFALSNKTVSDYVTRVPVVDNLMHLKLSAQAVWPPLENIINQYMVVPQFHEPVVEFIAGYLVVSYKLKQ